MLNGLIETYSKLAESHGVDPGVFVFLMIVTTPFWYHSWYLVIKEANHIRKIAQAEKSLKAKHFTDHKPFFHALIYNFIIWAIPYVYVIFWGENLPIWFWIFISTVLIISLSFQFNKIFKLFKSTK